MNQPAVTSSPQYLVVIPGLHLHISRRAIPYLAVVVLAVALIVLAANYASMVAERNDYLELIRFYGLGCNP